MPEITIYTNDGDCANGVAEINPFTVGDATDEWTLKFNNGTDFYSPSNVTMRVGHTNGLPNGTYNNAFKWVDRTDNKSTGSISVANGVPTLSFDTDPLGGVVGTNGVYILRGPDLDGSVQSATVTYPGKYLQFGAPTVKILTLENDLPGSPAIIQVGVYGQVTIQTPPTGPLTKYIWFQGYYTGALTVLEAGSGFSSNRSIISPTDTSKKWLSRTTDPSGSTIVVDNFEDGAKAVVAVKVNAPEYEFPFKRDESGNDIIAATTLSPYSDGEVTGATQYDHSSLVIRPETVAIASLTQSGTDWVGTMDPINAYTTARLSLRNSTQLDLQIRGDGRTLFQGQLTILNKIA